MFLKDVVEDLTVDVVKVGPWKFASVDAAEHVEGPDAPIGGELSGVEIGVLFGGDSFDFVLDSASPVEHGSTYIPCEGFDF